MSLKPADTLIFLEKPSITGKRDTIFDNLFSLEDKERTPHRKRQREITPLQEQRIISLRKKYLRESKFNIALYYQRIYGEKISSWKVQKVIEKYHLYYNLKKTAQIRKKRQRALKKKRITELKKQNKTGFLIRLNYLFQEKIENIQTDNGSEFAKYFEKACQYLGIDHYFSRARTPKDLAVLERFNRTLKEQFLPGNFTPDISLANQRLTEWIIHNDFERPHQSLGYLTPFEFHQKYHKVLPMYPSRAMS